MFSQSISTYESDSDVELIDFTTGDVLIDVANTSMWTGTNDLKSNAYSEILYTSDGENILHMPIRRRNWSADMQKKYNEIADAAQENVTIKSRSIGRQRRGRQRQPMFDGMDFDGMDFDGMDFEDIMFELDM